MSWVSAWMLTQCSQNPWVGLEASPWQLRRAFVHDIVSSLRARYRKVDESTIDIDIGITRNRYEPYSSMMAVCSRGFLSSSWGTRDRHAAHIFEIQQPTHIVCSVHSLEGKPGYLGVGSTMLSRCKVHTSSMGIYTILRKYWCWYQFHMETWLVCYLWTIVVR